MLDIMVEDNKTGKSVDLGYTNSGDIDKNFESGNYRGTQMGRLHKVQSRKVKLLKFGEDSVIIYDIRGKFNVNISDSQDVLDVKDTTDEIEWGQDLYMCTVVISFNDRELAYVVELSDDKAYVNNMVNKIKQVQTEYDENIPFEFIEGDEVINFGTEYKYRDHLPDLLDEYAFRISLNDKKLLYPLSFVYLLLVIIPVYFGAGPTVLSVTLITILTGFVGMGYKINSETNLASKTNIPQRYVSEYKDDAQSEIFTADIIEKDEYTILHVPKINASWTFTKNDFGGLRGIGGKVIDRCPRKMDTLILSVSENKNSNRGIESDDNGDYIIHGFDKKLDWMI